MYLDNNDLFKMHRQCKYSNESRVRKKGGEKREERVDLLGWDVLRMHLKYISGRSESILEFAFIEILDVGTARER